MKLSVRYWIITLTIAGIIVFTSGCSVEKMVAGRMKATFSGARELFMEESDPELVEACMPFILKLIELFQQQSPHDSYWLVAAGSTFVQYAYFLQLHADFVEEANAAQAEWLRRRATSMYKRASDYLLKALELKYPGFRMRFDKNPEEAVKELKEQDIEVIYWLCNSLGGHISLSKDDPYVLAKIVHLDALVEQGLQLNPDWGDGSFHTFMIRYVTSNPNIDAIKSADLAWQHFKKALIIGRGKDISPFVVMAEAVAIPNQDLELFDLLIKQVLAFDPELYPFNRVLNKLMVRRAQWLYSKKDELFVRAIN